MSERWNCSSTKYGPSVSAGTTTHAGTTTVEAATVAAGVAPHLQILPGVWAPKSPWGRR